MKIPDPQLVVDYSYYSPVIKPDELITGGVVSAIVGLYLIKKDGKYDLHPTSLAQARQIADSQLVLQAYVWDDIIEYPEATAEAVAELVERYRLPVKFIWADQEQWWTNWTAYYMSRKGLYPAAMIKAKPENISNHNERYAKVLKASFPNCGIYTNKNFIAEYAPGMDAWLPQYPQWVAHYGAQPHAVTKMTWTQLKKYWMPNYDIILSAGQSPANVKGHQFTGDTCILPGAYNQYGVGNPLDVSVFDGTFINSLRGGVYVPPGVVPPSTTYTTTMGLWVLSGPGTQYKSIGHIDMRSTVTVTETSGVFSKIKTDSIDGWVYSAGLKVK